MIKISAINDESEVDSDSEEEVTREALEQIAQQQYTKALDLQHKGHLTDATQLLKDLLDTELLYEVKKPDPGEKFSGPLLNLKYLCYKNLASMHSAAGDIEAAIEAYYLAAELDDTDLTLWHRLGMVCMQVNQYEKALYAFQHGLKCNPKHWPCLDKIITILLGLDCKEQCIAYIHDALQLDPGYLRGLAYRKHLYTVYHHLRDYMEHQNPIYKWDENKDYPFDEAKAEMLIKEAEKINEVYIKQQKDQEFKYFIPILKLKKPISSFTWKSVGESLVHMHHFMTENSYSHACPLDLIFEKEEPMEVCEETKVGEPESKPEDIAAENKKPQVIENNSENENNDLSDLDKPATDSEKMESDIEAVLVDTPIETPTETPTETPAGTPPETTQEVSKTQKKIPVRRRGSALSFLQQWEWCNKRRSGRKKQGNKQPQVHSDDNIYETLRRMIPVHLSPEFVERKENKERAISPDISNVNTLYEKDESTCEYFGTELEQRDVREFINKYTTNRNDIINMLHELLATLAHKWQYKWPEGLPEMFIEANKCYKKHYDDPVHSDEDQDKLVHYVKVHILIEEFIVNGLLETVKENKELYEISIIESINIILTMQPHIFSGVECLQMTLRYQWLKLHVFILNKNNELALECLYLLLNEFEAMGENKELYTLKVENFTFKPTIVYHEVTDYIKFLERNKKLATVLDLYQRESYDEVLSIIMDSFEYCKTVAKEKQDEIALDFAAHLSLILDTYWALGKSEECFEWSFICLHEALKHYFRYTSGSNDYEKWTMAVVKILSCMEHILQEEGLSCLDSIPIKGLSQGLEDLIRIIGHQVETKANEMPFGTVSPWIIMHYILQKQEDLGKGRIFNVAENGSNEDPPNPLMVLFVAHEQLGNRSWCMSCDAKLLNFTLDVVAPLLRSPALSKHLEQIIQYMEQCVFCLFGHPGRKSKLKYLTDHNVKSHTLDWIRAQKVYEVFRPPTLPALEGKVPAFTTDSEQLFLRILALLPPEMDPQKHISEIEKYVRGTTELLPHHPLLLPHKMRDIYFLLGDYYFKREEGKMAIKYNMLDLVVNNDRLEAWAEISLAKALNLERLLNSCKNINNDKDYLTPAKSVIRCFKRALELDPSHCNLWIEYGMFVYTVHSFCSRVLKQASESLSMEDFASLENKKEDMLDTTQKCFSTVLKDLNSSNDSEKVNEDSWLQFYMLGKVAEKRNRTPSIYLHYYSQAVKSLQEADATYPLKINYNSPAFLCIEVLELHYRIHASILKYIEQHENKPIPTSVGKVFAASIEEWKNGPFSRKIKKDNVEIESEIKNIESLHAANILKRSISDAGEEDTVEAKRQKIESAAAKVRRSASYDTERFANSKDQITNRNKSEESVELSANKDENVIETGKELEIMPVDTNNVNEEINVIETDKVTVTTAIIGGNEQKSQNIEKQKIVRQEPENKDSSSSSYSSLSYSDSSSNSSSDSSNDSRASGNSANETKSLTEEEIMKIVEDCLDALEDCASRFPPHYKAIYRLAHYHFYYKKGKNIERCRDLMLSMFTARSGQKQGGLFSERKNTNFFNNIWKIPMTEVDRGGGFAFHMNRATLLTMEILKEIDDHKTLLDLSLYLQRVPEPDKTYLRDCDREELAQQAFSLCVQSLKGQLMKFCQQADLKSNEIELQALKSLMLDIYRAYIRAQKQPNSKMLTNLLVDGYKLVSTTPITEGMNLVDLSMKYCQSLIQALRQQATQASLDKSQSAQKKQTVKTTEVVKTVTASTSTSTTQTKPESSKIDKLSASASSSSFATALPKLPHQDLTSSFANLMPLLNDPLTSMQTAAALSYMNNLTVIANYASTKQTGLQTAFQNSLPNSFQAEFYRQFFSQALSALIPPPKQKRGPKVSSTYKTPSLSSVPPKSVSQSTSQTRPSASIPGVSKPVSHSSQSKPSVSQPKSSGSNTSQPKTSSSLIAKPKTSTSHSSLTKSMSHSTALRPTISQSTQSKPSITLGSLPSSQMKSSKSFSTSTTLTKATPTPVITSLQKSASAPLTPSMGTVLSSLPPSMSANLSSFGSSHSSAHSAPQAHMSGSSNVNTAVHSKPPMPHQQVSPGKTLQEKLAERQKNMPLSKGPQDFSASLSRLPSSIMITKTGASKQPTAKKTDAKKSLSFGEKDQRPKHIPSDEVIILDDD